MAWECAVCGKNYESRRDKCACGERGSLLEVAPPRARARDRRLVRAATKPRRLSELAAVELQRLSTGLPAFDELLGGGAVLGSSWLLSGAPGAGKSTLAARVAGEVASRAGRDSLFVSAEMRAELARLVVERSGAPGDPWIFETASVDDVERVCRDLRPAAIVLDSLPRLEVEGERASEASILGGMLAAVRLAKDGDALVLAIAHATKDNNAAGPLAASHDGDAVIWLDHEAITVRKHRYGPAGSCPAPRFTE